MKVFCTKCNEQIENLEAVFDSPLHSTGVHEILCSVCAGHYKVVKRPTKRKLTKEEKFEVIAFAVIGVIIVLVPLISLVYLMVASIIKGKASEEFPWTSFLALVFYIIYWLWSKRINKLEKEKWGNCCSNSDCDFNKSKKH